MLRVMVTKLKTLESGTVVGRATTSKKNKYGEYDNFWWDIKFVGNCKDEASFLEDKCRLDLKEINLEQRVYDGREITQIVVFAFDQL